MSFFDMSSLDELSDGLANLPMFPYFEIAHYIVSVMALREQPGALVLSRISPLACWFSSMLHCFGGAVLTGIMLAEPPIGPLSNSDNILLASIIWYLIFYCPMDWVYSFTTLTPIRVVLSAMKEVTRTWKILGGIAQAQDKYEDNLLIMIAIGWAKGAGGGLISNFEQLVRGIWRPETNELIRMSYPTKITLIGAVLFALEETRYLPVEKHHLMLFYTVFTVVNKSYMMLTGSSSFPFAPIEWLLFEVLFTGRFSYGALTLRRICGTIIMDNGTSNRGRITTRGSTKECRHNCPSPVRGDRGTRRAKDESDAKDSKKYK
ncbi:trimeric intracellular cation channel type B isoform X1 [Xiphophorus couchianus]|uniref:Transmembrane protein 38B n=2 Tax=Xiphophorus couchianus TaxID=32473 RepID=A0A3B5KZ15_9TELE|nr:trimeric intracellular cation channel type B isoform X1 [Xiphophorus couchianus]